jgi:hypothetical protein
LHSYQKIHHTRNTTFTNYVILTLTPDTHKIKKTPIHTFHNKKALLKCEDIECNPGPRINLLSNHPQIYLERQKHTSTTKPLKLNQNTITSS